MESTQRPMETVKELLKSIRSATRADKMSVYDTWSETYEQDMATLGYHASSHVAKCISAHFSGDRGAAVVLDVACGTGMVAKQMKKNGFEHFVGIDGSKLMLEEARKAELYQDLQLCILGEQLLPAQRGSFDVVVICGGLSSDLVKVSVVRELCNACKPGGYVIMTCRHGADNLDYKTDLERELKEMEEEGLWSCVVVTEVKKWMRSLSPAEEYVPGSVYLYKKV